MSIGTIILETAHKPDDFGDVFVEWSEPKCVDDFGGARGQFCTWAPGHIDKLLLYYIGWE